jgi:tRNA modification GTPase
MSFDQPTIFAPASAPGRAGVAVVRVSGSRAGLALRDLVGKEVQPRQATLCLLRDPANGEQIDRALVLWFKAPASFTGEDVLEIHCHGSRAVVDKLMAVLAGFEHFRLAEPGEFARRAFENGKMDLTAVEGLADLINAETDAQRRQALRQSEGELGRLYENWRTDLVSAGALIVAILDFSDEEDIGDGLLQESVAKVTALQDQIRQHLDDAHRGEMMRDGVQVVIAGAPNVGKSSLLNRLARRDAAIISSEAGTTRDVIEVRLDIAGYPVVVMDTAGIRDAAGAIEQEGIRRTIARVEHADLVLLLENPHDAASENDVLASKLASGCRGALWRILSKSDLYSGSSGDVPGQYVLALSAKHGDGISGLIERIGAHLAKNASLDQAPMISRARHRQELESVADALDRFSIGSKEDLELRAEDLRLASDALGRLTGRIDVEELLGALFSEFCIGK